VLKQGVLKRGLCDKLIVDNGSAYRSGSLQGICARLSISTDLLQALRAEGKASLERWHRTFGPVFERVAPGSAFGWRISTHGCGVG